MSTAIHWFRRDLRLRDNPALSSALAACDRVYGAYAAGELTSLNSRQRAFVDGCLKQLRANLERRDASLTILEGAPEDALAAMARRVGATAVYAARAYSGVDARVERAVAQALRSIGVDLRLYRGHAVHEPEAVAELKAGSRNEGYRVFPPFYENWKSLAVAALVPEAACNARDDVPGPLPASPVPMF